MANEKIYIIEEDVYGYIITRGAFGSLVKYNLGGIEYQVMMLDEDFIIMEEIKEDY